MDTPFKDPRLPDFGRILYLMSYSCQIYLLRAKKGARFVKIRILTTIPEADGWGEFEPRGCALV